MNNSLLTKPDLIPEIKTPYVLFVGKKSPRRQFPTILKSVQALRKSGLKLDLVAVGPSSSKVNHEEGLIDLGYVSDQKLATLYQNAIALIWPSSREGFGLPLAESMASGCPIITTPVNAIAEVAGQACLGLTDSSSEQISSAIMQLMECPDTRMKLIQKGLQQAIRFHPHQFAENVADAINTFAN